MAGKLTLRERARSLSARHAKKVEPFERRALSGVAGASLGFLERKGILPIAVGGAPIKPVLALLATLAEMNSHGSMRRYAGTLADSCTAIYSYEAAKTGNLIAGDE